MTGGLLQLVAKGSNDVFLTREPQVTMFKMIYRRHTNFSRTEYDLQFRNVLDFGKEATLKIKRLGDLLHRMFLVIYLPEINIVFRFLTIGEVKKLLKDNMIIWDTDIPDNSIFNEDAFIEVVLLIDEEINELNSEIIAIDNMINILEGPLSPDQWKSRTGNGETDVDLYFDDVLNTLFVFDRYDLEYKFVTSHKDDRVPPLPLANSDTLQRILFEKFVEFGTGASVPRFDPLSFNDENLFFIFNVDTANYNVTQGTTQLSSNTVFRTGVDNVYGNEEYTRLDSYKIFDSTLNQDTAVINSNFDVQRIKESLIETIRFDLQKNILLLNNIYRSLINDSKFMFYRFFGVNGSTFNTGSQWTNLSLFVSTDPNLDDNFNSDFPLQPLPGEPDNLFHPMAQVVSSTINDFHIDNRGIYRTNKFNDYFNKLSLWERTDIGTAGLCVEEITGDPDGDIPNRFFNIYFLNYIPVIATEDIPEAINKVLNDEKQKSIDNGDTDRADDIQDIIDQLVPILRSQRNGILNQILPKVCIKDDFVSIDAMNSFRNIVGPNGDILITSIIRQDEFLEFNGTNYVLPKYVIRRYQRVLNNFSLLNLDSYLGDIKPILDTVLGYFNMSEDELPTFTTYSNFDNNMRNDIRINTSDDFFSDAISSIWNIIVERFVSNYNLLYDNELLGRVVYEDSFGLELLSYLEDITETYFNFDINNPTPIEYYFESTLNNFQQNIANINTFLTDKLSVLIDQLNHYDLNFGLMTMKNLVVPKPEFYFEEFLKVLDFITGRIEIQNDIYFHINHDTVRDPVIIVKNGLSDPNSPNYDPTEPHNNAMDIVKFIKDEFIKFARVSPNPFNRRTDPNKFRLWNTQWLPNKKFDADEEIEKYDELFGMINPQSLYNALTLIDTTYNGFVEEDDIYDYMLDIVINASFFKDFPSLKGESVSDTNQNIINYLNVTKEQKEQQIENLEGDDGLLIILENSLQGGENANFAWIKEIGYYIIEHIKMFIGDQLIDIWYGEMLHVYHQLVQYGEKERGHDKLIGNVPELYEFNTRKKRRYKLIIPLQFNFNRKLSASLPLVALQHTEVKFKVKLRSFDEVSFYDPFTRFVKKNRLKAHMLCEYIYIENDERENIAKSSNEYLMDKLQYNGDLEVTYSSLDDDLIFSTRLYFKSPTIELFWMAQYRDFIDGSQLNGEIKYSNYGNDFITGKGDIIKSVRIRFNDRTREQYKDTRYYNDIVPYERHNSNPGIGINNYCFSLLPENYEQPAGASNLSKLDHITLDIIFNDDVIERLKNGRSLRLPIYCLSYTIVRVMSGLAGVAYQY